jgi:uncharacterized protein (DUF849 family)
LITASILPRVEGPDDVRQLWHGYGEQTWDVISAGVAAGVDVRVGLEDVLVLPNGRMTPTTPSSSPRQWS